MLEIKEWLEESTKLEKIQISKNEFLELNDSKQRKKVDKEGYKSQEFQEETIYNHKFHEEQLEFLRDREFKIAYLNLFYPL